MEHEGTEYVGCLVFDDQGFCAAIGAFMRAHIGCSIKELGAWDAINLDGGGSSAMLIDGKNVNIPSRTDFARKLSVIVSIVKKKNT